jgi:predicted nuclease with TOPRIM domain
MNYINIEDIMMRNQELVVENQALRLRIEELKNGFEGSCMACEPVGEMNKKLRDERDEALKKIDELEDVCGDSADRMVELVKERDDARREVCDMEGETAGGALLEARKRGWDCFKEDDK